MNNQIDVKSLVQHTSPDGFRVYRCSKGIDHISCTTLLGMYEDKTMLYAWEERLGKEEADRQRDIAAERGTAAHLEIENYLELSRKNQPLPLKLESPFATNALRGFYDTVTALEMEAMVVYSDPEVGSFAGSFDSLIKMPADSFVCDGELLPEMVVISDLKTKKASKTVQQDYIFKHLLQLSGYVVAKEIETGSTIDGAVLVFSYPRSCKTYFLSRYKINHYWEVFQLLLKDYFKIQPLELSWKYLIAQSEYKWNDNFHMFESFAPTLITKALK